jgi:hypothetical protein
VDAEPNSGTSFDELQRGIEGLGQALEDIELLVTPTSTWTTLAMWCSWPARSGAAVAAIYVALPVINNYSVAADADDEFARDTMLRHGIPGTWARRCSPCRARSVRGARADVSMPLRDREALEFRDRTLHVHHRPATRLPTSSFTTASAGF